MRRALPILAALVLAAPAAADDLYRGGSFPALGTDRRAGAVGDLLTVVVYESSEASNATRAESKRETRLAGSLAGGPLDERGAFQVGGGYAGGGAVTRSDRLVAQLTVTVNAVLPNGDLLIAGRQAMKVNGENTVIGIEGRVRAADVNGDNRVLSSRIADARIIHDGRGFVARSAKPGLVAKLFRFLGLG